MGLTVMHDDEFSMAPQARFQADRPVRRGDPRRLAVPNDRLGAACLK